MGQRIDEAFAGGNGEDAHAEPSCPRRRASTPLRGALDPRLRGGDGGGLAKKRFRLGQSRRSADMVPAAVMHQPEQAPGRDRLVVQHIQ